MRSIWECIMTGIMQMVLAGKKPNQYNWPVANVGDAYGGGYFGGQINISGTKYNLIVAPKSTGESSIEIVWGPYTTTSVTSVINGPANTTTLAALGSTYEAATFCNNLNSGGGLNGRTDWYLPAKNELEVLMYYFKPTNTDPNNTSSGSNANAVLPEPISTNYTTALPPQTIASAFVVGGAEAFSAQYYWSSTETNSVSAVSQNINNLNQLSQLKDSTHGVRAIRRVLA